MKAQQRQIVEDYVSAYNNFDIDGMIRNLDQNIVFENISKGKADLRTEGLIEFRKQAELSTRYFQQRKQSIESWSFRDSGVVIHIHYKAILAIELPNGMKRGDTLELKGTLEFEFGDLKITKITDSSF